MKLRHPWLDRNDPANSNRSGKGFWVPTPEEIKHGCELAKRHIVLSSGRDERCHYRPPREIKPFDQRETTDGPQLCDCPYWGTEFQDD